MTINQLSARLRGRLSAIRCLIFASLLALPFMMVSAAGAATENFSISLNQVVSNGVPAPGAGNLERGSAVDIYTFTASAGQEVFFNEVFTNNCSVTWTLKDSGRATIFSEAFGQCGPDAGTFVLAGGTYTLTFQIPSGVGSANYAFVLVTPESAQSFEIDFNEVVSNGVPAAGAGNIETPGAVDIYTFTADPGQEVFFNEVLTTSCNLMWTLTDESEAVIFSQQFGQCGPDAGTFILEGGTYTLRVEDPAGNITAVYSFGLITPENTRAFSIELDQLVANGVPAPGAGNIEQPGDIDTYTFTVDPGQVVFFNEVSTTSCSLLWTLADESEAVIFSESFGQCVGDPGTFTLAGGTYTLTVEDPNGNLSATYSFVLVTPESNQLFNINLDEVVSPGAPAPGAGSLETPGAVDIYSFTAAPGTQVFFNEVGTTSCNISWTLKDSSNATIFSQQLGQCGPDPGTLILDGGAYTLRVEDPSGNSTAQYTFILVTPASYQFFDLDLTLLAANGIPAPGAGNLEKFGAVDIYTFSANEGDQVFFNEIVTSNCGIFWTVTDDDEETLFSQPLGQCSADAGVFTLEAGTYTIRVEEPGGNSIGTYSFVLCSTHAPDINCDGAINGADLGILLSTWGTEGPNGDIDGNGVIDGADLGLLLAAWTG
jgi:hypothetical protein